MAFWGRATALVGLLALAACAPGGLAGLGSGPVPTRRVEMRVAQPTRIPLPDRGIQTLGVVEFDGPGGRQVAARLATLLGRASSYRVVGPRAMEQRLMRAGLAVRWSSSASGLQWVHERTAVDAVVVGRVEEFSLEEREETKETFVLEPTGTWTYETTEDGKIGLRETLEYKRVPLYCRSDRGSVAVAYRVWDSRSGEAVATLTHRLRTEVPSFCYRGDIPERLAAQARQRLLARLFERLNERFVADVSPRWERAALEFEVIPAGAPHALVHRNELALVYAARGEPERAVELWRDCLADLPEHPGVHFNLAQAYRAQGRTTLAASHLRKALAVAPEPRYRRALAGLEGR